MVVKEALLLYTVYKHVFYTIWRRFRSLVLTSLNVSFFHSRIRYIMVFYNSANFFLLLLGIGCLKRSYYHSELMIRLSQIVVFVALLRVVVLYIILTLFCSPELISSTRKRLKVLTRSI